MHRVAIVLAVIENPWAGQGFVADLAPLIDEVAPELGELLSARCIEALGVPAEAYGKAGIVGLDGELEHALGPHPHAQVRQLLPHRRERHDAAAGGREGGAARAPASTSR